MQKDIYTWREPTGEKISEHMPDAYEVGAYNVFVVEIPDDLKPYTSIMDETIVTIGGFRYRLDEVLYVNKDKMPCITRVGKLELIDWDSVPSPEESLRWAEEEWNSEPEDEEPEFTPEQIKQFSEAEALWVDDTEPGEITPEEAERWAREEREYLLRESAVPDKIAPEEALKLADYSSVEDAERVYELQKAFENNPPEYVREGGYTWEKVCLLNFVYQVGRIDGIRKERAKKQK